MSILSIRGCACVAGLLAANACAGSKPSSSTPAPGSASTADVRGGAAGAPGAVSPVPSASAAAPQVAVSASVREEALAPKQPADVDWVTVPRDNARDLHLAALADGGVLVAGENSFGVQSKDDMFLTRLAASGQVLWHKPATGRAVRAIAVQGERAFVATEFVGRVLLDQVKLSQSGNTSVFLGALGIDGGTQWGRLFDTADFDRVSNVVALASGGVALSQGVFAPIHWTNPVPPAGGEDAVVTRWSAAGELLWVKNLGWPGNDTATSLASDASENLYVAGTRWKSASTYVSDTERGPCWPWLAQLSPSGEVVWQKDLGSQTGNATLAHLARTTDGRLVVAGGFRSNTTLGSVTLTSPREAAYIAELSSDGNVQWAHVVPALSSLAVDTLGRIFFANDSGIFVERASDARIQLMGFTSGSVQRPVLATTSEPGRLFFSALASVNAKIGSSLLPKPATLRFRHMPDSVQSFVARLSY